MMIEHNVGASPFSWQALIERLPYGVAVCRLESDGRVSTLYQNEALRALLHSDAAADDLLTFVHPTQRERFSALLRNVAQGQPPLDLSLQLAENGKSVRTRISSLAPQADLLALTFDEPFSDAFAEEGKRAFQIASRNGNFAVWVYDLETRTITQSFSDMGSYGYPLRIEGGPDELIETGGIFAEDTDAYREAYRRIHHGADSSDCTVRVFNRLTDRYEWQRIILTRENGGSRPIVIGLATNVELQKEAEIRYERENRLRQELVKDSVIYYRINLSSELVEEMYSEAMDMSGISLPISMSDLIVKGLFDGCYAPDLPLLRTMLSPENMRRNYENGKTSETFVYRRYLPDKGLRWLKASITKLKRVSSDDVIAFYTAFDIDDEKKEQILLRDVMNEEIESLITMKVSTRQIRILKENLSLPDYSPDGSDYFTYTQAFRSALFQGMLAEDAERANEFLVTERILRELERHPILQGTYRIRMEDGSVRRKKLRVFYLDESKQDIIFVRRDITDLYNEQQRQSEVIKRAMDDAKTANEAKSAFLSRMSHDMRTPLNAIIGYSGQILRSGASEAQKDEFLDDIHSAGEYLLGIINDVLDMTKIESNKMVLHPEPYTCAAFKESIETVIAPLCVKKGVAFDVRFPDDISIPVMLDKVRFNQIFINILSNAVKFTPKDGRIVMSAKRDIRPDGLFDETFVVSDNGCGMSEDFLPHAFDSFSQEYAGQAMHNEQGTGLGLSIVKQLVELMGGEITVESALGQGTTFTVRMTITPASLSHVAAPSDYPKGGLKGLRLLLCEDHPMNRKIAIRPLEKEGCIVDVAEDGRQGVDMFSSSAEEQYNAVLMDIRMPRMDGLSAAKAIRALHRDDAQSVPIIAMTANAFVDDRRASIEAGMNEHIAKPIDPTELYRTLYRLTAHHHLTRTPKILVVDDIEMNAALVASALKERYETIIALDGREALEQLAKNPYIVAVITDVQMPVMDGGELIRTIRDNRAYDRIALIANTEFGNSRTEEAMIRDGADDFIYKPTAPALILRRVNNVLSKYR